MDLEQRLAKLERENRRMKLAGALAAVFVIGVLAMGQSGPDEIPYVIRAKSFDIVRDDGLSAGSFWTTSTGSGQFIIYNAQGKPAISIGVDDGGNGIVETCNRQGQELVKLGAIEGGKEGAIATYTSEGQMVFFR